MAKESPPKDPSTGKFISTKPHSVTPESEVPLQMRERKQPDPPAKKEETPEELEGLKKMASLLLGQDEKWDEGEDKKKEPEKKKEPVKAKEKPKPEVRHEPEPEVQKLNTAELPKLIAEAVATAIKQPDKKEPEKEKLSEEDELTVTILREMEQRWPKKYPNLSERYLNTQKALVDYAKKWAADNPGQEFDEDGPEHEEFYKQHDVDWDDTHFNAALARIEARQEREGDKKTDLEAVKAELDQLKNKDRLRDSEKSIAQEQTVAAKEFWNHFNGDYAGILLENGELNLDKVTSLKESDGEGLSVRAQVARSLDLEVAELYKLMGNPDDEDFKPFGQYNGSNPVHANLDAFGTRKQKELLSKPKDERLDDKGRDFLSIIDYWKLPKDQRNRYWTYTARDLALLRADELAVNTQRFLDDEEEKFTQRAKKRGLIKEDSTVKSGTKPKEEPEEDDDGERTKPQSPSSRPSSKMAAAGQKGGAGQKSGFERFINEAIDGR